jgi:hypothetical protein
MLPKHGSIQQLPRGKLHPSAVKEFSMLSEAVNALEN